MSRADRYSASFWLLLSVFVSYQSYKLGMGSLRQPGPGFVSFWTAVVVGLLSLAVMVLSFAEKAGDGKNEGRIFTKAGLRKVIFVVIALFLYVLLLESVGFLIMTLLLLVFLLKIIEKKSWLFTLLAGVTITIMAYLIFETALESHLPKGFLEYMGF
ncbi:MAG TPA: tripartite tricarboxylate transporter TctB family protein [Syntrophorhabdaceae bacterium]|nr:tripartite tricarboxylate transporter TctB family protein [Syntrophorhabdaceae bacterium]